MSIKKEVMKYLAAQADRQGAASKQFWTFHEAWAYALDIEPLPKGLSISEVAELCFIDFDSDTPSKLGRAPYNLQEALEAGSIEREDDGTFYPPFVLLWAWKLGYSALGYAEHRLVIDEAVKQGYSVADEWSPIEYLRSLAPYSHTKPEAVQGAEPSSTDISDVVEFAERPTDEWVKVERGAEIVNKELKWNKITASNYIYTELKRKPSKLTQKPGVTGIEVELSGLIVWARKHGKPRKHGYNPYVTGKSGLKQ